MAAKKTAKKPAEPTTKRSTRKPTGDPLTLARTALEDGDHETALTALLTAWRDGRSRRLADLIDRAGAHVDAARPAIGGRSVKERTDKWLSIAAAKDPCDLGRLLATPWPGTWQPAKPVLDALLLFPDDPRLAKAFAALVDATPYDTWTSRTFWSPLFRRLELLRDVRTLPLLEAQLGREKPHYYARDMRPMEERVVQKLRATTMFEATLDASAEATLAAIESLFTGEQTRDRTKARGEAELLAAIYESPDDDAPRLVYADWLGERGDPRGEFIALQLAPSLDEKARKRASALVNKHGEAWAGPLHKWVSKKARAFERGFLAVADIELESKQRTIPTAFDDPAWATVRSLGVAGHALTSAILALPSMRHVKELRNLREADACALARGAPRPRLESVEIHTVADPDVEARAPLLRGDAFPSLRRLAIVGELEDLEPFLAAPLARRLERVTLRDYHYSIGPLLAALARHGLTPREIELRERPHVAGWSFRVERDEAGRPTRLRAWDLSYPGDFEEALATLEPDALTEIVVEKPHRLTWDADYVRTAEAAVARFTNARIDVPWERLRAPTETAPALSLDLRGKGLGDLDRLATTWRALHAAPFSVAFDGFEIDYRSHASFGPDPLADVRAAWAKKRTSSIKAYRKSLPDAASMSFRKDGGWLDCNVPFRDEPGWLEAYLGFVRDLLDREEVELGSVPFFDASEESEDEPSTTTFELDPPFAPDEPKLGWLTVFGPKMDRFYPFDELEKLRLEGVRWLRTKRNLVLVHGASPRSVPGDAALQQLRLALCDILWTAHRKRRGFVLAELVRELLSPAMIARGFVERPSADEVARAFGVVRFRKRTDADARWLVVTPWFPTGEGEIDFDIQLTKPDDEPGNDAIRSWSVGRTGLELNDQLPAGSAEEARASLTNVVERLDREILPWFDAPPKKRRR